MVNHLQHQHDQVDPEINLIINALESAIDICKALGKDSEPFEQKLHEIVVPADNKGTED